MNFIAYIFLALIYNIIHLHDEAGSSVSIIGYLKHINLSYVARGRSVTVRIEYKSNISELIRKVMKLESMIKD
jgi:hypothetical protein